MDLSKRTLIRTLLLAVVAFAVLAVAPAMASTAYVEGVVMGGPEPECVLVKDQRGNVFTLEGTGWYGIVGNDYVRLQGTIVPENRCGTTSAIQVTSVEAIWRDESHKVIVYERSHEGGHFSDWVKAHREREWREWETEHHIPPPPPPQ